MFYKVLPKQKNMDRGTATIKIKVGNLLKNKREIMERRSEYFEQLLKL